MSRETDDCSRGVIALIQKVHQKGREENDSDPLTLDRDECALFAVFTQTWRKRGYTFLDDEEHCFSVLQHLIQAFARDSLRYLVTDHDNRTVTDHDNRTVDTEFWCSVLLGLLRVYQRLFPQYQTARNVEQPPFQRLSAKEQAALSQFINPSADSDPPVFLLHNVHAFCQDDCFHTIQKLLEQATPETLKFSVVQLLFHVVFHIRMWLHAPAVTDFVAPLKLPVFKYLSSLSEEEIKTPMARNRAELMWSTVRGDYPVDRPHFDRETFSLALKYLTSSTLTVRIFGLAQINAEVNQINKACSSGNESQTDVVERTCEELTRWMLESQLVEKLFGPSLHVELVKLSQPVLIYLATEGRLTSQHLNCIWAAARLKHSSHAVFSLLPELVRHLDVQPLHHLSQMVWSLPLDEHTTETLQLSFVLTKRAWKFRAYLESSHSGSRSHNSHGKRKWTSRRARRLVKHTTKPAKGQPSLTSRQASSDSSYSLDSCSSLEDLLESNGLQLPFGPQLDVVSCQNVSLSSSLLSPNNHSSPIVTSPVLHCEVSSTTGAVEQESISIERTVNDSKDACSEENLPLDLDDEAGQVGVVTTTNDGPFLRNTFPLNDSRSMESPVLDETVTSSQESLVDDVSQQHRDYEQVDNSWLLGNVCATGNTLLWDLMHDDMACRLQEGVAAEVNKYLCQLVCTCGREDICKSFIEGCLSNLDESRSVVSSLCLLSEIFSARCLPTVRDSVYLTRWADTELSMIRRFFTDLLRYTNEYNSEAPVTLYSHEEEIKARLEFLSSLFHWDVSTEDFQLGVWHVDALWSCLVKSSSMSDAALRWFLQQLQSSDHHTLSSEAISHLFFRKMPELKADCMTVIGLKLWQQLVLIVAQSQEQKVKQEAENCGLPQIWDIALHACDSDVIMMAMNYINNYYINAGLGSLERESEFIDKCMDSLTTALSVLNQNPIQSLHKLCSGLTLLQTHIEAFSKRYCYHLRKWKLQGCGVESHVAVANAEQSTLKLYCFQPGREDKETCFEMCPSSYVAELRAEVEYWLEKNVQAKKERQIAFAQLPSSHSSSVNEEHSFWRIVVSGQELSHDVDSKTLEEVGLKDQNRLYVSQSLSVRQTVNHNDPFLPLSELPEPPRGNLPMTLLLHQQHFGTLFQLMEQLYAARKKLAGQSDSKENQDEEIQRLTRMTWDLVAMLPTSSDMLSSLSSLVRVEGTSTINWDQLLDSSCPFQLLYSLQIVEKLVQADSTEGTSSSWKQKFIAVGGLECLVNILKSGHLEMTDDDSWSEWHQKCMSSLLLLISRVGESAANQQKVSQNQIQTTNGESCSSSLSSSNSTTVTETDSSSGSEEQPSPAKKHKPDQQRCEVTVLEDKPLCDELLALLNDSANLLVSKLMRISEQAAICACLSGDGLICAAVVSHSLRLLSQWYHCNQEVQQVILQYGNLTEWLRSLTLTAQHAAVRDRAYTQLLSMCVYETEEDPAGSFGLIEPMSLLPPLLQTLLLLLPEAATYTTSSSMTDGHGQALVRGCQSYFNLVSTLVESCDPEQCDIDFDKLAVGLTQRILTRPVNEVPRVDEMDEGLVGLLSLCSAVMRHEPEMKNTQEGKQFIKAVARSCLFDVATKRLEPGCPPKCKTLVSRQTAFNLLCQLCSGSLKNFEELADLLAEHHLSVDHPWYYSPADDARSDCGFVGLVNLGATCYMASCLQQLYMVPEVRAAVLSPHSPSVSEVYQFSHQEELHELQKMFSYLLVSERKAHNPRSLCRMYKMDNETLNPCEQKDMTEFFTDLVGKMEEMSLELRQTVHSLFRGVMTNNVVSLDCSHVSCTKEEFYLVRCMVENMKDLYESLAEVTVKDTLEGDNMYTCSQCGHKVRAEKRACFKVLPRILCINTMRYTFNMVTMMKEKINTHFVFPMRLDMSSYTEETLMGSSDLGSQSDDQEHGEREITPVTQSQCCEYELVGVVVHTGTADGGHYYSFVRDRIQPDKWYWFNDAEVRPFDPSQIPSECFGGEMTTKTYDSRAERFVDFSFEKSHSAYMLFYERCATAQLPPQSEPKISLPTGLAEEIWQDNRQLLKDQCVFDDVYGQFMWKLSHAVPRSMRTTVASCLATKIGLCYVLGTLFHSKDQRMLGSWSDWLLQQLDKCPEASEWLLRWAGKSSAGLLTRMLLQCPAQPLKQIFMRLVLRAIQVMRTSEKERYLQPFSADSVAIIDPDGRVDELGMTASVTEFMKTMLSLIKHTVRHTDQNCLEVFQLLHQIAIFGQEEQCFLLSAGAVRIIINFYLHPKPSESSQETEDDYEVVALLVGERTPRPLCLEHMVKLISLLVDTSRRDKTLAMPKKDLALLIGSKDYPFIYQQTKDSLNLRGTAELILALCKHNRERASSIIEMIMVAVCKLQSEPSQPFLKLLGYLVEVSSTPGVPPFTALILDKIWKCVETCPVLYLDWLTQQVPRSAEVSLWMHQQTYNLDLVEEWLLNHSSARVRMFFANLLASLVPSPFFRQLFRSKAIPLSLAQLQSANQEAVQKLFKLLLYLFDRAQKYVKQDTDGLVAYFSLMTTCLVSKSEKLMVREHFPDLWRIFQDLAAIEVPVNSSKQAVVQFWYYLSKDCSENIDLIVKNDVVSSSIGFCYILADADIPEVVNFNNRFLYYYYGLLRMCCIRSEAFAQRLALHTNTDFAFKQFLPSPAVYPEVSEELFVLLEIFAGKRGTSSNSPEAVEAANQFRKHIIPVFVHDVDGQNWAIWLKLFNCLLHNADDMTTFIANDGLTTVTEAFGMLQQMYHEATACNVATELLEVLVAVDRLLKMVQLLEQAKTQEAQGALEKWAKRMQLAHWLLNFLNPSTPDKIREVCLEILLHLVRLFPSDCIDTLLPVLEHTHRTVRQSGYKVVSGAFFPRKLRSRSAVQSHLGSRRMCELHMHLHSSLLEVEKGVDRDYDTALFNYYAPYHQFAFELIRVALSRCTEVQETAVNLSALLAVEGASIHLKFAAEFWAQVMVSKDKKLLPAFELFRQLPTTRDYCDAVLFFYRKSLAEASIYSVLSVVFPKVYVKLLPVTRWQEFAETLIALIVAERCTIEGQKALTQTTLAQQLMGNLSALHIVLSAHSHNIHECQPGVIDSLVDSLSFLSSLCHQVELKLKELRCPVEAGRATLSSQRSVESTVNSSSKDVLDCTSEKHSEECSQNHQEGGASCNQLLSPAKKARLEVQTDSDEGRKDIEADIGEQKVPCQDGPGASGQVEGGDPAACVDVSWLEKLEGVDDQKRLLSWTAGLVAVAEAIVKQVQQ